MKRVTAEIVKDWFDDVNVVDISLTTKSTPFITYNTRKDNKNTFMEIRLDDYEPISKEDFIEINKFLEERFAFTIKETDLMILKHQKTEKFVEKISLYSPTFCLNGYALSYRKSIAN